MQAPCCSASLVAGRPADSLGEPYVYAVLSRMTALRALCEHPAAVLCLWQEDLMRKQASHTRMPSSASLSDSHADTLLHCSAL